MEPKAPPLPVAVEPKPGLPPKAGALPNAGDPPKDGLAPKAGAPPNPKVGHREV